MLTLARVPSGLSAIPVGPERPEIVETMVLVAVSITETVVPAPLNPELVTYARVPSGLTATAVGTFKPVIVATI